jgi:hypothetical protein
VNWMAGNPCQETAGSAIAIEALLEAVYLNFKKNAYVVKEVLLSY